MDKDNGIQKSITIGKAIKSLRNPILLHPTITNIREEEESREMRRKNYESRQRPKMEEKGYEKEFLDRYFHSNPPQNTEPKYRAEAPGGISRAYTVQEALSMLQEQCEEYYGAEVQFDLR